MVSHCESSWRRRNLNFSVHGIRWGLLSCWFHTSAFGSGSVSDFRLAVSAGPCCPVVCVGAFSLARPRGEAKVSVVNEFPESPVSVLLQILLSHYNCRHVERFFLAWACADMGPWAARVWVSVRMGIGRLMTFVRYVKSLSAWPLCARCRRVHAPIIAVSPNCLRSGPRLWPAPCTPRHGVRTKYPHMFDAVSPIFDKSLSTVYMDLKKSNVQLSTFLNLYSPIVSLVCDSSDIEQVVQHSSDLTACSAAVCRLVNGSGLGSHMLADKMAIISAKQYSDDIDKVLQELEAAEKVTLPMHVRLAKACAAIASKAEVGRNTCRSRTINIKFLGSEVPIACADLKVEYEYKIAAILKTRAWGIHTNGLLALSYESWIRDLPGESYGNPVPMELLGDAMNARRLATDMIAEPSIATFQEMKNIWVKKYDALLGMDKSYHLELAWLAGASEALESSVLRKTLACLPTETAPKSFSQSLAELAYFRKSDMVTRSGPQAKERVASCETVVHEMSRGVPPQATPGMLAGFYNDMLKRASFFFVHQVSNDAGQKTSTSGKAGIDKYIQETWPSTRATRVSPSMTLRRCAHSGGC